MDELTALEKKVVEVGKRDSAEKDLIICDVLAIGEYDLEEAVQNYLNDHPNATFAELDQFICDLCPPLEIVDDDEMDREEE